MKVYVAEIKDNMKEDLMYQKSSEEIDGMIFNYELEQNNAFWMYKTYIPLSIIYFDKYGTSISKFKYGPCTKKEIY